MEQNQFKFANKDEQLKRANRFLIMGFTVFYITMIAFTGRSLSKESVQWDFQQCSPLLSQLYW